ncbi:MAG TPA: cupin domain-containing protein [Actinomycetota bacterium]|nr:cupin domain-containing protein [Actinomycetota bacterium]
MGAGMDGGAAIGEERGTFSLDDFAQELAEAESNRQLGTALLLENDHVRIFEVRLGPGERGPFHVHDATYFWTVVEPGRGLQRFVDGSFVVRDYALGETKYLTHSPDDPLVHDLENVGETRLRFVTVELKH